MKFKFFQIKINQDAHKNGNEINYFEKTTNKIKLNNSPP